MTAIIFKLLKKIIENPTRSLRLGISLSSNSVRQKKKKQSNKKPGKGQQRSRLGLPLIKIFQEIIKIFQREISSLKPKSSNGITNNRLRPTTLINKDEIQLHEKGILCL